jgi:hypothetical protein
MSDDFINQFEQPKPPRPEFTAALYQRITQPMKTTTRTRVLRTVALSFAMVAVIATVLFFLPSTRAFADSIIRQIKKGNVTIQMVNDAAAASQVAGFTVLAPAYLPDGYTALNQPGAWAVSHEKDSVMASITYMASTVAAQTEVDTAQTTPVAASAQTTPAATAKNNQTAVGHLSIIEQMYKKGAPATEVNRPEKQDVTVRGQAGAWMPASGKSMLAWDENGISYIIVTSLPKEEALKVAESLGK